ncbi:MAG TPA: aldehyde dehydrogenase (NADP(+)) [Micromonosporaceae bacterium]|nr:aldehyde dehydrogenase (NADP(+)) [Micromonosporaceae bacterium]
MTAGSDQGMNPTTGEPVGAPVPHTTPDEVDRLCRAAAAAAPMLAALPLDHRARFPRAVADALEDARPELVALADAETGLGATRLDGEVIRTATQLRMFADAVTEGSILELVIDLPDPSARPAPRPDLRRMLVPIGPVAVFSASNFPFAFSVAGGDTASALAAGCPVVVKAHSGHPGLSVLCGRLVAEALAGAGAPPGSFGIVHGTGAGRTLITHPAIAAGGFTGSLAGGRALFDLASGRPDPIPFYGELGSLNPTVVTPGAVAVRGAGLAADFVKSLTLGSGQFCTKPGLLFLPKGHGLDTALADALSAALVGPLLNARIRAGYLDAVTASAAVAGTRPITLAADVPGAGYHVGPQLLAVSVDDLIANTGTLLEEAFGPAGLVIEYADADDLDRALDAVPGSLTATLHADPDTEVALARRLADRLAARAGRVIWSGWPTGVAVTWAQQHGGPWPATTASIHTSVGVTAVRRFQRPVVYQDAPQWLLPEALRDGNPLRLPRRVNGVLEQAR